MALSPSMFEEIHTSRFISFTIPSPNPNPTLPEIRIAVLDSPIELSTADSPPVVAAMIVPEGRESDWIFSTECGQIWLLLSSPNVQRLILIGKLPVDGLGATAIYRRPLKTDYKQRIEEILKSLVTALAPKICFSNGNIDVPFMTYEDDIVCSTVLKKCVGPFVGEMLVEDVELEKDKGKREFRRRLRFKRMPGLIQTEIRIVPKAGSDSEKMEIGGEVEFQADVRVLVHVYLVPMVASLSLIASHIEERVRAGVRPKALCVGVGGGALLGFLRSQLGFQVLGVEMDEEVLKIARRYFGLEDGDGIRLHVGDALQFMQELAGQGGTQDGMDAKFDVIMVDLDSSDVLNGVSAPPLEFVSKDALLAAKSLLCEYGIFVINVIPPTTEFYEKLKYQFKEVFHELCEIDADNGENSGANFVLIAKVLPTVSSISDSENNFLKTLRMVISGAYMDSIRRV